jgi:hypothetical protein
MRLDEALFRAGFAKKQERQYASGWFSHHGEHDHRGIIDHEFGHSVHLQIRARGWTAERPIWDTLADGIRVPAPDWSQGEAAIERWVKDNNVKLRTEVSRYGAKDPLELMAEIWAEYSGGKARPHIRAVGAVMKRLTG